jgi:hypothetical protein
MKIMKKTVKVTVRMPQFLRKEVLQAIVNCDYGMRGKSRWVLDAITDFLSKENFIDFVDIGSEMSNSDLMTVETFYLPIEILDAMDGAILKVRHKYPMMEGVKSVIIRSSIIQQLLRPKGQGI